MASKQIEKINAEIGSLKRELRRLRKFMCGASARDPEGAYKASFVREIQKLKKGKPAGEIRTKKDIPDLFA